MAQKSFILSKFIVTTVSKKSLEKCFKEMAFHNSVNPGVTTKLKKATYLTLLMDKCGKTFKLLVMNPSLVHHGTTCLC